MQGDRACNTEGGEDSHVSDLDVYYILYMSNYGEGSGYKILTLFLPSPTNNNDLPFKGISRCKCIRFNLSPTSR